MRTSRLIIYNQSNENLSMDILAKKCCIFGVGFGVGIFLIFKSREGSDIIQIQMDDSDNLGHSNVKSSETEKYQKIKVLGQGSMGKAYLVQSAQDGKQYVMKRINIGHLDPKDKQNALRESQLHSLLKHPNIVQFKQVYQTTGDKLCIIMEYAQGGDLQEFIRSQAGKYLSQQNVLTIFSQICLGLQEVHSKKIIHRDLKNANIFLSKDKQVKIGDFGISRTLDKTQMAATSMIGTPYYLSPEMVEGKPYSTKADIWALGIILYQLCSFKLPFQANSLPVLALKILKGSFPPIPNQYSKDLKALLLQLLSTDQKKRPSVEVILTKPFINKYLPQQEKAKLIQKQQLKIEAKKVQEQQKKVQKVEKADDKQVKEKAREKREELRKQMRDDLKKKRGEKDYETEKTGLNVPQPQRQKQLKKSPRKDISITPKIQTTKVKKEEVAKPWKNKKVGQKKDITIQIFAPQIKNRDNFIESYKIEEKPPQTQASEPTSTKQLQGRKSMPLITQKVSNYHYVENKLKLQEEYQEEYQSESMQEEIYEDDFNEMMNNVKNIEEITRQLPNPSREVCLFEDSGHFDSTVSVPQHQQRRPEQLQNMKLVLNAESLEQLRFILQQNLGDNRFKQAYSVVKEHLDNFYELLKGHEQDRQKLKAQYMYNRQLLKDKLHFLTKDEFQRNLDLLFSLIIYEQIETQQNNEGMEAMRQSKYDKLL